MRHHSSQPTKSIFLALVLCLTATSFATANPIAWGTVTGISGDTDVSTHGTLVAAFNFNGAATTVNGVSFQPFPALGPGPNSFTVGNYNLASGFFGAFADSSSATPPFSSLSSAYQSLLGTVAPSIDNMTLTLNGLVVGQLYEIQFWSNNSADKFGFGVFVSDVSAVADHVFLRAGGSSSLGSYVIGTFTADTTSKQINLGPDEVAYVNGFQLRALNVTQAEVPEPASVIIWSLLMSIAGLAMRRHRQMQATAA